MKRTQRMYEERREKLLQNNKRKQEEMLRKDQEVKSRKLKKRPIEERWAMTRWLTQYIDENSERWHKERQEREGNETRRAEEWRKMNRFEKIRIIREKMEENRTVTIRIKAATLPQPVTRDQAEH